MSVTHETVEDRLAHALGSASPWALLGGLAVLGLLGAALVAAQEPGLHSAVHDFRHATGIVCH